MDDKQILSRAAAIQRYLISRPDSADTLENIHGGWIRSRGSEDSMDVTQAALEYLRVAGFMTSGTTDTGEIWRRASVDAPSPSES